jgi:hypothetical protein
MQCAECAHMLPFLIPLFFQFMCCFVLFGVDVLCCTVGWLKTVDQYYLGANNTIQHAAVHYILDTVIEELAKNPNRKFIYVEQAFFQMWWQRATQEQQQTTKELVQNGQLEFINGSAIVQRSDVG